MAAEQAAVEQCGMDFAGLALSAGCLSVELLRKMV